MCEEKRFLRATYWRWAETDPRRSARSSKKARRGPCRRRHPCRELRHLARLPRAASSGASTTSTKRPRCPTPSTSSGWRPAPFIDGERHAGDRDDLPICIPVPATERGLAAAQGRRARSGCRMASTTRSASMQEACEKFWQEFGIATGDMRRTESRAERPAMPPRDLQTRARCRDVQSARPR